MSQIRFSLSFLLLLGALAILFTITILVAWSIIFTEFYAVATGPGRLDLGVGYWMILSIGCAFLVVIVVAIILSLLGNVRATSTVQKQNVFIDSVTHELKSPLASMRLAVETLERRELTTEMRLRFMQIIKSDLDRLTAFIEHILAAGRLEHAGDPLKPEPANLFALTHAIAERLRQRYHLEEGQLLVSVPAVLQERDVLMDGVAFDTILTNLLDNAVKYSDEVISVVLQMDVVDNQLAITLTDRGLGIPRRELKKVFQRFFRVNRKHQRAVRGTGLGLYVTQLLCRSMGGKVSLHSEGEQKGTTARVTIPLRWSEKQSERGEELNNGKAETAAARG